MRTNQSLALGAVLLLASGCSSVRDNFRPVQVEGVPFVDDIGELQVLEPETMNVLDGDGFDYTSVPESIHYGRLGQGEDPGIYGGATFQFRGTGGPVCVVVDPEAMFWNREISTQTNSVKYDYEDIFEDDGDLDLKVGLTAYYTGSPGTEIGDFTAIYADPSGEQHELEFNECVQVGYGGASPVHPGRATVEYCEIDTSLRPGVMYTAVLETFSLPIDDSVLAYGAMAYAGSCDDLRWRDLSLDPSEDINDDGDPDFGFRYGANECVIPNEVEHADPEGLPEGKEWFPLLEQEYCTGKKKVNNWCEENPGQGCNN